MWKSDQMTDKIISTTCIVVFHGCASKTGLWDCAFQSKFQYQKSLSGIVFWSLIHRRSELLRHPKLKNFHLRSVTWFTHSY